MNCLLDQKECLLDRIKTIDYETGYLEEKVRVEQEERLDGLRNVERKLNIGLKELERLRDWKEE